METVKNLKKVVDYYNLFLKTQCWLFKKFEIIEDETLLNLES